MSDKITDSTYTVILLVDTCVWIDLATDPELRPLIDVIDSLMRRGRIVIVTAEVIRQELNRHQPTRPPQIEQRYRTKVRHARSAFKTFVDDEAMTTSAYQLLKHVEAAIEREVLEVEESLNKIHDLLQRDIVYNIPSSDELKLAAADRALNKVAPFHDGRNSYADALIFESYLAVLQEDFFQNLDVILVSANTSDFSDPSDHRKLHPDLREAVSGLDHAQYSISIAKTLNSIEETDETLQIIERQKTYVSFQSIYSDPPPPPTNRCPDGEPHQFAENLGACLRSRYGGLTWHVRCRRCGTLYDTGEFCD